MMQFIPQVIKTFKMKDHGSLSVLMLKIQAPTNLGNAFFMWFGEHEDWTTFTASMADGAWEFVLLGLCIYYDRKKKQLMHEQQEQSMSELSQPILDSSII